ncbi:protease modulator HflC [Persicimonas caeni]|uniref:Protein HflC n=1 Tax=Persicimonas caeni TaxID=2292766 RepID=A0A4Y6PYE8_PERCE|nr:protease modulator HflC [Persicimonas caeni]QDG53352.1 protease modulator HflC [Persicimonas caeni]QED34573.1 protease modulator HflC [Persicimonas caeni]
MKKFLTILAIFGVILGLWLASSAAFVVNETQQAIVTQFGRPVGKTITEPGLYFKKPFVQTVHYFDKRFLEWNGYKNQVPTKDKRFVWVDTYARWRITDPLKFYQRVRNEKGAHSRLDDIIDGETRDAVANHNLLEIVRTSTEEREPLVDAELAKEEQTGLDKVNVARTEIMTEILESASKRTQDLGIEIMDVRFRRINYNEDVRNSVYQRMIAERKRIAERYRSEGRGEAANIRGRKERELQQIESGAFRKAEEIRGKSDAEATRIYAEAYQQDPEFYQFLRSMETYPSVIDEDSTMLLSTDNEFLKFMTDSEGKK